MENRKHIGKADRKSVISQFFSSHMRLENRKQGGKKNRRREPIEFGREFGHDQEPFPVRQTTRHRPGHTQKTPFP
ncbi:MAG: hypothetical protein C75L2_00460009 [Leptospirillum sp. Group II 'C75']|nr:MAG: hypothetical protein C75L2_00460009 [Leptospirillum sp. Group II 'C75']